MARSFAAASSQKLEYAGAVATAAPLTVAARFYLTASGVLHRVFSVSQAGGANTRYFALDASDNNGVRCLTSEGGIGIGISATPNPSAGTWHHAAGVWSSASNRVAYLNGSAAAADTTSVTPGTLDTTNVGVIRLNGTAHYGSGYVAELGVWDVALTAAEVASLSAGFSPRVVRPQSLVAYWPLVGGHSPEIDLRGGFPLSPANSPAAVAHPRVFRPSGRRAVAVPAAGGGGGFQAAWAARSNVLISPVGW